MLCELKIENLALIESMHLQFNQQQGCGLVVMTGETGAGKSIMLRAIHLLTGGRGSVDWIRNGAEKCVVEALFEVRPDHQQLMNDLEEQDLDHGSEVIIKRIISSNGRSRIYVNGSLATGKMVALLTDNLLNIASQHDHQQLLQTSLHLDVLDTLGDSWKERREFSALYNNWSEKNAELKQLRESERGKEQRRDFLQFQLTEIGDAEVVIGEDDELARDKKKLKAADSLKKLSQNVYRPLSTSVLDQLVQMRKDMEQAAQIDPDAEHLAEQIAGFSYQAEDLANGVRQYRDTLSSDPHRLDLVNERIDLLQGLKRKYGTTLDAVVEFGLQAEKELQQLESMEQQIEELSQEVSEQEKVLQALAGELSRKRHQTAAHLEESMAAELLSLAFEQARFEVHWQENDDDSKFPGPTGLDRMEFFFSANPGEDAKPLARVASGGELSRLMLALKCLLARKDFVESVVFDEVDAGIGGEAAEAVARKIQELATHHQVFCITHLPQIAARGGEHYKVSKAVTNGRTSSVVSQLSADQRIDELSRMLAGDSATIQTRAWAEELVKNNG